MTRSAPDPRDQAFHTSISEPGPVDISMVLVVVLFDMYEEDWCLPLQDEESVMALLAAVVEVDMWRGSAAGLLGNIGTAEIKHLLLGYTNWDMQVMQVLQRVMNVRGRIIAGTTLPRILRKTGHRE